MYRKLCVCIFVLILKMTTAARFAPLVASYDTLGTESGDDLHTDGRFLIIPEDVPAGMAAIYGFAQPLHKGNDHRIGFGFRFGNHADLQILYELGPQTETKPLQASKTRSTTYRQRFVRRRPLLELLIRTKNGFSQGQFL